MGKRAHGLPGRLAAVWVLGLLTLGLSPAPALAFQDQSADRLPVEAANDLALAIGDVDGDADDDVVIGAPTGARLLRNDGNGVFVVHGGLPLITAKPLGLVLADFDGDADLDLFVANAAGQNRLLRNDGTGGFQDLSASHLPVDSDRSTAAAAADLDRDGDLDLVVANRGARNRLLLNDGSGRFSDASEGRLAVDSDPTTSVALADVDGGGAPDILFGNDGGQSRLHLNNGLGVFTEATAARLPAADAETLDARFIDSDADGDPDLVLANGAAGLALWRNDGGVFSDATSGRLPVAPGYAIGVAPGDIDVDGAIDLIVARAGQDLALRNDGHGVFAAIPLPADTRRSFAAALFDADRDFDPDVLLATPAGQDRFLVNDLATPRIRLSYSPAYIETNDPVTFNVAVFDEDGVAATTLKVRKPDGSEQTLSLAGGAASFVPTQAGTHVATVTAQDGLGNVGTRSLPFDVLAPDTTAPVVTTTVTPSTILFGQSVQIEVAATDDRAVVSRRLTLAGTPVPLDSAGRATVTPVATGTLIATGYASDAAGNEGSGSRSFTVTADTLAPTVQLALSTATVDLLEPVTITASATDNVAVSALTVTLTGPGHPGGVTLALDANGQATFTPYLPGTHTVVAQATDPSGNLTARSAVFEAVGTPDTTPPTVSVTVTPATVAIGNPVLVTVSASDDVAVAARSLTINGTLTPLDASGTASYLPPIIGTYTAVATATDPTGNESVASTTFRAIDPASDTTPPAVAITSPADSAEVAGEVTFVGTVDDATLVQYTLGWAPLESSSFTTFATGTAAVLGGPLGTLDTTLLENGFYQIRLSAVDVNGRSASVTRLVNVTGRLKLGVFTVSFQDKTIPVGRLPVSVTRTYDSRRRGIRGDFGYGWTVELTRAELVANRIAGDGWQEINAGGFLPTYRLVPTAPHFVTIRLGNEKEVKFSATPEPQTQQLYPFSVYGPTGMRYEPVGDTDVGTLTPIASDPAWFAGDEILDFDFEVYNPTGFTYTAPDGFRYVFTGSQSSVRYKLTRVIDPSGLYIDITPSGFTRSDGLGVTFARDSQGRITSITDAAGAVIRYEYDAAGDLAAVIDAEGNRAEFDCDAGHYLTAIRDPAGKPVQRNEYDDDGRLVAITDAAGNRIAMEYDLDANTQIVRDRRNNPTIYQYDGLGNVLAETRFPQVDGVVQPAQTRRTFDANQQVTQEILPDGTVNTYEYDRFGNVTREVKDVGGLNLTKTYTYDASGRMLTQTDARGNTTRFTYDANGNRDSATDREGKITLYEYSGGLLTKQIDPTGDYTLKQYDGQGRLITEARWDGNATVATADDILVRRTDYTYDAVGNKLTETVQVTVAGAPQAATTTYTYDRNGRLLTTRDPLGNVTANEYDAVGNRIAEIDPLGQRTTYRYNDLGDLVQITYPDGASKSYGYDADGNRTSVTDENGNTVRYEFDAVNRVTRVVYPVVALPDGGSAAGVREQRYDSVGNLIAEIDEAGARTDHGYDRVGRRTSTLQPEVYDALAGSTVRPLTRYEYDGNGNRTAVIDANGQRTEYGFDRENRPTETRYADGRTALRRYDALGHETARVDAAGRETRYEYDALGRQIKVSLPPPASNQARPETLFAYDELGNLLSQTDANGHQVSFTYDLAGRRLSRLLPGLQQETFSYDAAGRVLAHTDFNGATTTYAYDQRGRRTGLTHADGSTVVTTYRPGGQRLTVTTAAGTTTYAWDARDRLTRRTDPDGRSIAYAYLLTGKPAIVTTGEGATRYSYDAIGRLAGVTDPDGQLTAHWYDPVGNLIEIEHPNGTRTVHAYNNRHQLTAVEQWTPTNTLFAKHVYTLDGNGLRIRMDELPMGTSVTYVYDDIGRLLRETRTGANAYDIQYGYDAVGNRTQMNRNGVVTHYAYDANDRLTSSGPAIYEYDDNGNLTRITIGGQTNSFTYDADDRLIRSQTTGGAVTTFGYDADGQRITKTDASGTLRYLVDVRTNTGVAQVLEEHDASGLRARYTYGLNRLSQNRGGVRSHYHADGLGSIRSLTDALGAVTDSYVYDGWGNEIAATGTTENPYRFAGEPFDPNVGFYYLRARWYDPATGRFLSMDPAAGDPQSPISLHRYLYANDNPINYVDPTGLFTLIEVSVTLNIESTLQSAYTSHLVKFFFNAAKIAFCTIEPANKMQWIGLDMMFKGLPGGELLVNQGREQMAAGYQAIGQAAAQVYIDTLNDVTSFIDVEFDGVLKGVYEWASGSGSWTDVVPLPDEVAETLAFYEELEEWIGKFRDGYAAAVSGDPCQIFTFLDENADTILELMPDF